MTHKNKKGAQISAPLSHYWIKKISASLRETLWHAETTSPQGARPFARAARTVAGPRKLLRTGGSRPGHAKGPRGPHAPTACTSDTESLRPAGPAKNRQ